MKEADVLAALSGGGLDVAGDVKPSVISPGMGV